MSLSSSGIFEPITEPEILESIKALPTEDEGEPIESERHLMQMVVLIQSLKEGWPTSRSY